MSPCTSCCTACQSCTAQSQPGASSDPYALKHLLSAGTIKFTGNFAQIDTLCNHSHAEDGWHTLADIHSLAAFVSPDDEYRLFCGLDFLTKHRFLTASYKPSVSQSSLLLRIYLIPYDLLNIQGRLRNRDPVTVLAQAEKILRPVLGRITQDSAGWRGEDDVVPAEHQRHFLPSANNGQTLAQIYSNLPSPSLRASSDDSPDASIVTDILENDMIYGMRSKLYVYQRRSVAAMLQKEQGKNIVPDPLYVPLYGIDNQLFYYQPGTMEILRERPMTYQNRGGILCEELGTGKTVMILALIASTLDVLPSPEESMIEERPIFTSLSYRHFPFPKERHARKQLDQRKTSQTCPVEIPSLLEILLSHIRTSPAGLAVREFEDMLDSRQLWEPLMRNTPFYFQSDSDFSDREASRRKVGSVLPRVMYLSSATLIVVPPALLIQWNNEINKHCNVALRVLIVRATTTLPLPRKLASDYDIVLMTNQRFSLEESLSDIAKLRAGYTCQCLPTGRTRVPDCQCNEFLRVSPLLQIRWKRIVMDEGHNSASVATVMMLFARKLSTERRWIVTGTPTTNLLGLNFGQNSDPLSDDTDTDIEETCNVIVPHAACVYVSSAPSAPSCYNDGDRDQRGMSPAPRIWTKRDREDLRKLGNMMIYFLGVPIFPPETNVFDIQVLSPVMNRDGPRPGAIQMLTQVMASVMVRHRIQDVEKDIVLPPVKQATVLLDLDPYALKTYNVLQGVIAINAVDSERTDKDYLFHPRNVGSLMQLIENISQTLFWHVDSDQFHQSLDETVTRAQNALPLAIKRGRHDNDILLVQRTIKHLQAAAADKLWRLMQSGDEIPYRMHNIPPNVRKAWARFPTYSANSPFFLHPGRTLKLRRMVSRQPLISEKRIIERAELILEEESVRLAWARASQMMKKGRGKRRDGDPDGGKARAFEVRKTVESTEKLEELRREYVAAQERLNTITSAEIESEEPVLKSRKADITYRDLSENCNSHLLASSPLAQARIGNSTSTKLNYILNEVLRYSSVEKFLIFSKLPFTLAHIAEGLELANVKFLLFTTDVGPAMRERIVTTFETSDTFRVFLMELKHGARGLNLIAASRIIFCEPVWQADVESQAIKRAHRIGQTRPINVKTLAIRSTFEEEMMNRRAALKDGSGKLPGMMEETGIRRFLQNPTFIDSSPSVGPVLNMPLLLLPGKSRDLEMDGQAESETPVVEVAVAMDGIPLTPKKRKVVHFVT